MGGGVPALPSALLDAESRDRTEVEKTKRRRLSSVLNCTQACLGQPTLVNGGAIECVESGDWFSLLED